jgi:hypothetical protein
MVSIELVGGDRFAEFHPKLDAIIEADKIVAGADDSGSNFE